MNPSIDEVSFALPGGITLVGRAAGPVDAPRILFLHGFPEAAFVWDALLARFGAAYRCVAPNLRGFGPSSAPADPDAYRTRHLVGDLVALIEAVGAPLAALVAHDWGGALAWTLAAQRPELLRRLVMVNAPHPAAFLRELQSNPAQQAASAYMNFLRRPDAPALLAENDFARLWPLFARGGEPTWLDDAKRDRYRAAWRAGLAGGCNYYRASPLHPPTADDRSVLDLVLPAEAVTVRVPTTVVWGERDVALLPALLDGLDAWVPQLTLVRVPDASHWIVHERPDVVGDAIAAALASLTTQPPR